MLIKTPRRIMEDMRDHPECSYPHIKDVTGPETSEGVQIVATPDGERHALPWLNDQREAERLLIELIKGLTEEQHLDLSNWARAAGRGFGMPEPTLEAVSQNNYKEELLWASFKYDIDPE